MKQIKVTIQTTGWLEVDINLDGELATVKRHSKGRLCLGVDSRQGVGPIFALATEVAHHIAPLQIPCCYWSSETKDGVTTLHHTAHDDYASKRADLATIACTQNLRHMAERLTA